MLVTDAAALIYEDRNRILANGAFRLSGDQIEDIGPAARDEHLALVPQSGVATMTMEEPFCS